jgi:adenylate cyclase
MTDQQNYAVQAAIKPNWARSNLPNPHPTTIECDALPPTESALQPVTLFPHVPTPDQLLDLNLDQLLSDAYRLRFPREEERRFKITNNKTSIIFIRVILATAILGYAVFGIADLWSLPITYPNAWIIRYGMICPIYSLVLYLSFLPKFQRSLQRMAGVAHLVGGLGLVLIMAIALPTEPGYRLYFLGLIFIILGIHFSRLKFVYASSLGWIITVAYVAVALFNVDKLNSENPSFAIGFLVGNFFYLAFMNIAGMFVSYMLEVSARSEFLQRRALAYEKRKSESLLFSILPQKIAKRLTQNRGTIAQEYPAASILFADIVNFTPLSERLTPTELISLLNDLFSEFDQLVDHYGLEKIKTIGDCYMVAAGVPNPRMDHADSIAELALDMVRYINHFAQQYHYPINLRIGIHSGSVVAGVIGRQKFMYDLWGDTVNTASRMESHGEVGKIQISHETYKMLSSKFLCESQGAIAIKGKGDMETWHLLAKRKG